MDSVTDSSDDCEGLLKKAVEVNLPCNFNPNSVPHDGMEYLHHVIYERRNIKKQVRANIDPNKFRKNQTVNIPENKSTTKTCKRYLPSMEWQVQKINDFRDFKQITDKQIEKDFVTNTASFNEFQFIALFEKEGPELSSFLKYSQSVKIRMLEIITKYLDSSSKQWQLQDTAGEWIFAILSTLNIPLSPNGCHIIREFTRTCRKIRSRLSEDVDETISEPLSFFICICTKVYGQVDLAD